MLLLFIQACTCPPPTLNDLHRQVRDHVEHIFRTPTRPTHRKWLTTCETNGRDVSRQHSDTAPGTSQQGQSTVSAFPGAELPVTLSITHRLGYFPSPQRAERVRVQRGWSVTWPGVMSNSQSAHSGWLSALGCWENTVPPRGQVKHHHTQTYKEPA